MWRWRHHRNSATRARYAAAAALATCALSMLPARPVASPAIAACDAKAKPANLSFVLKDVTGAKVSLSTFKGKVLILDFWATWCIPCRTEIPDFVALQAKYRDRGLQVLGVSVDDTVEKLKPYVAEMKMTYPVLLGRGHPEVLDAFGPIPSVPVSVVIGRDGTICTKHIGIAPMGVFEGEIAGLL